MLNITNTEKLSGLCVFYSLQFLKGLKTQAKQYWAKISAGSIMTTAATSFQRSCETTEEVIILQ